ncbi:hypothetical protein PtB15_6B409 [Puccinia triticina]|nr:hypothetical protein PtB15_6B409 [Puccinia triticina]
MQACATPIAWTKDLRTAFSSNQQKENAEGAHAGKVDEKQIVMLMTHTGA